MFLVVFFVGVLMFVDFAVFLCFRIEKEEASTMALTKLAVQSLMLLHPLHGQ